MVTNPGLNPGWDTAHKDGHTRVLWLSRHEVTEEERTELVNALGPCVIQRHDAPIGHPAELHTLMAMYDPDRVVSVLPLVLQESLVSIVFMRQMEPVIRPRWHHRRDGDMSQITALAFSGFDEILELVFKKRRLIPTWPPNVVIHIGHKEEAQDDQIFEYDDGQQDTEDTQESQDLS